MREVTTWFGTMLLSLSNQKSESSVRTRPLSGIPFICDGRENVRRRHHHQVKVRVYERVPMQRKGERRRNGVYIFQNDVVGGYAIGCDEEEVLWRGRRVDVTDLALGK
jgi:hypothetical protein